MSTYRPFRYLWLAHYGLIAVGLILTLLYAPLYTPIAYASTPDAPTLAVSCPSGTVIYVDTAATGADSGDSWSDALPYLQDALTLAASCPAVTEIWVAQGIYYPDEGTGQTNNSTTATFTLRNGVALYGGFTGQETTRSERDWRQHVTVLSGDLEQNDPNKESNGVVTNPLTISGTNAYHVVTTSGGNSTMILDGFTVTAGYATAAICPDGCGAGLYNASGSPTLHNLTFIGNRAGANGGAIFNNSSAPGITNTLFQANYAKSSGGALYNDTGSSPTLTNVLLTGNRALSRGGAIFDEDASNPTLTNVTISANRCDGYGGGIYNGNSSNPTLVNVILWANTANVDNQIHNRTSSVPRISYSLIQDSGGSSAWVSTLGIDDGNNLASDPTFVTAGNAANAPTTAGNFALQSGSPAADAGHSSANSTATDLVGATRTQGAAIDLGAYESAFQAQLAITKSVTPTDIEYGESVTYSVSVANHGDAYAYGAQLTDTLPSEVTFAAWQLQPTGATYQSSAKEIDWTGIISSGHAVTFTFTAVHNGSPGETITNTAKVDYITGGDSAAAAFTVATLPTISIVATGASEAAQSATFRIDLSKSTRKAVTVTVQSADGLATAPADYTATNTQVTIPAGSTSATFSIPVINDLIDEDDEDFIVSLSAPVNGVLGTATATATITDNDTAGNRVTPTKVTIAEPATSANVTIKLDSQPMAAVTVHLSSSDTGECSVSATTTLDETNWQNGVTVAVTAVDDFSIDGAQSCVVQATLTSTDPKYNNMAVASVTATVQDNDVAGVTYTPATLTVGEASVTTPFTMALTSQPAATVTVKLTSQDTSECTVPTTVDLDASNWQQGVAVPMMIQDDDIDDGDQSCAITAEVTSSDTDYAGLAVADLPVTVVDDDTAGITVENTTLTVAEPIGAASFKITLQSEPTAPVTVTLTSQDSSECTTIAQIRFDHTDWNLPQVVTAHAIDDEIDDGDQLCVIQSDVTSADGKYAAIAAADVDVTVQDDGDTAGVTLAPTTLVVSEPSQTSSFLVTLDSEPTAQVTVQLQSADSSECTVTANVKLDATNWKEGKEAVVSAVDDNIIDGAQSCIIHATATSSDSKYQNLAGNSVTATVNDDDVAGVVVAPTATTISEPNTSALITLKLTSQPAQAVTVLLSGGDASECTFPASVVISVANWRSGVGFTVQAVNDNVDDGDQSCTIHATTTSSDSHYEQLVVNDLQITVQDDDVAAVVFAPAQLTVNEPDSDAATTVTLASQPTAPVTLTFAAPSQECVAPTPVMLTSGNWQQGVNITITALDDAIDDDNQLCAITTAVTSSDGSYQQLAVADLPVTVTDDDTAGVNIAPDTLTMSEPNGSATFTVSLSSEPTGSVTVMLTSEDASECSVPASVAIAPAQWNEPTVVTVTALDDAIDDGDQHCTVRTDAVSQDGKYNALAATDVAVTVQDDGDTAGVTLSTQAVTVQEPNSSSVFTLALTSEPVQPVTVTLATDNQQCQVSSSVVLDNQNWRQGQTITVRAVDDDVVDGAQPCTVAATAHSNDVNYAEMPIANVQVTVEDDGDTAGVVISPTTLVLDEATSANVLVALTSQPIAPVLITLTSNAPTECQTATSVTLDALNWRNGVTTTVTAVADGLDDGVQPCTVATQASSDDDNYADRAVDDIAVTVNDTDVVALQISAEPTGITAQINEPLTYRYHITNTGSVTMTVTAEDDRWGEIALNPNVLPPNGIAEGTFAHTVSEADLPGPLQSTVQVTGVAVLGTKVTEEQSTTVVLTTTPQALVDLERLSPPNIAVGTVVTYQLTITNLGYLPVTITAIEGRPDQVNSAAMADNPYCQAPLTLAAQATYQCLLTWFAQTDADEVVNYTATVHLEGFQASENTIADTATVVVAGPTGVELYIRLYLPVIVQ
ncbi:MAG: Calx-beta domain-containing protein [Caldilineaceae bacterium]